MGETVHTWECCRCGMGGLVYQTTMQCLELTCQHRRCGQCKYFVDSVGPAKAWWPCYKHLRLMALHGIKLEHERQHLLVQVIHNWPRKTLQMSYQIIRQIFGTQSGPLLELDSQHTSYFLPFFVFTLLICLFIVWRCRKRRTLSASYLKGFHHKSTFHLSCYDGAEKSQIGLVHEPREAIKGAWWGSSSKIWDATLNGQLFASLLLVPWRIDLFLNRCLGN